MKAIVFYDFYLINKETIDYDYTQSGYLMDGGYGDYTNQRELSLESRVLKFSVQHDCLVDFLDQIVLDCWTTTAPDWHRRQLQVEIELNDLTSNRCHVRYGEVIEHDMKGGFKKFEPTTEYGKQLEKAVRWVHENFGGRDYLEIAERTVYTAPIKVTV